MCKWKRSQCGEDTVCNRRRGRGNRLALARPSAPPPETAEELGWRDEQEEKHEN